MKDIAINISKIVDLPEGLKEFDILDLTGSIQCQEKIIFSDFFNSANIYPKMLKKYKLFSEKIIEEKELLDIKINNLSIYWISFCAVKYHSQHWAKDFFLLITLLEENKDIIHKKYDSLTIIIPLHIKSFKKTIEELLTREKYKIPIVIIHDDIPYSRKTGLMTIIKTLLWHYKKMNSYNPPLKTSSSKNLFLMGTRMQKSYVNLYLELKKIFDKNKIEFDVIPVFEWREDVKKTEIPEVYYKAKPSLLQMGQLFKQIFYAYNRVKKSSFINVDINGIIIPLEFLKRELIDNLNRSVHYFILNRWLKNYFSKRGCKQHIFYDNEFYQFGRSISAAISLQKNITTYGIQHGNFNEIHTVYSIYDAEIDKGLPMPNHFITWGSAYSQLFLLNNSLPTSYTLPLGNSKYINLSETIQFPKKIKSFLWCLTTPECMEIEWQVIKDFINNDVEFIVRLHPLNHVKKEAVEIILENNVFSFCSERTIEKAFKCADLIITSAHSTIFLDAMAYKKYCIRITSRLWNGTLNVDDKCLQTVGNKLEFKKALNQFQEMKTTEDINNNLLELSNVNWQKFLIKINE